MFVAVGSGVSVGVFVGLGVLVGLSVGLSVAVWVNVGYGVFVAVGSGGGVGSGLIAIAYHHAHRISMMITATVTKKGVLFRIGFLPLDFFYCRIADRVNACSQETNADPIEKGIHTQKGIIKGLGSKTSIPHFQ